MLCYILAALFFLYGVYMLIYSIDYIQSYESTGLIDTQNVIQYVDDLFGILSGICSAALCRRIRDTDG